ncbi:MAG: alpha-amylase family glycosyl hydrolase [Ruminococcus sp.]|nr:alpha-amylase family glycosyl hydrolase [Ruminococcus sp.]
MKKLTRIAALLLVLIMAVGVGIVGISAAEGEVADVAAASDTAGITVYYKCEGKTPYIYYWNALPENLETAYPGVKMTKATEQGEDWYKYTFKDSTKINLLFTDGTNTLEGQLSTELTRNSGEWWYKGTRWYSKNPDNVIDPVPGEGGDMREDTIYFVITTRFYDGDTGNNVHCWDDGKADNPDTDPAWRGDFKGLAEKLDYIKALGFSAIWITPVVENASGYDYHGYHAMDFAKVDSRYESDDYTYQDLINDAHDKGMKIIQDVVWQHTGNFGEAYFCNLFEKDYDADLSNLEESMIPTDYLLSSYGLSSASEYWSQKPGVQYDQRLNLMKNTSSAAGANNSTGSHPDDVDYGMEKVSNDAKYNPNNYFHTGYFQSLNWDDWTCKYAQIAGDCVDLNTENPAVAKYIVDAYSNYLDMGVDGFRVDTVRHISRLSLNMMYNDQINEAARLAGNSNFYMFGEICCRFSQIWYRDHACESVQFYTWDEPDTTLTSQWNTNENATAEQINENMNLTFDHYRKYDSVSSQPTSDNAFLKGITYHTPDYSQSSGMGAIDFQMHWCFGNAGGAFGIAKSSDKYFNDSTWNVVYVESHDYSPDQSQSTRYTGGTQAWAENMSLMFTFRGIPCLYYGGEVEFQKGVQIDVGPNAPLAETGRAYFGDHLEGTVTATDFSEYTASGEVANTLNAPLAKHLTKLNAVRRAIPALQKGQYTTDSQYVSGNMAYIRRYTDATEGIDSLALVTVSGSATFKNIPNGVYIDAITGEKQTVTNGTLTANCSGAGNARVYVCCASGFTGIDGAIGETGLEYLK